MKANRKFRKEKEAVSPVIATILLCAICVAMAGTLYAYVSGMFTGTALKSIPSVSFWQQNNRLIVSKSESGIDWTDVEFTVEGGAVEGNLTYLSSGEIKVGQSILVSENITMVTIAIDNFLIGTYDF